MSRAKRVRKARMKARQARRFDKLIARGTALLTELEERRRFRRELYASDLPDATKTILGLLADPLGAITDLAAQEMARRQTEKKDAS